MTEGEKLHLPTGAKLLAILLQNDDESKALAENIGAAKFLDKANLTQELIPAILELAPNRWLCDLNQPNAYLQILTAQFLGIFACRTKVFDVLTQNFL